MIEKLTKEQEKELKVFQEECLQIAKCTDPCDRKTAEKYIGKFYERIDKKIPEFKWFDSPLQCNLFINKQYVSNYFIGQLEIYWIALYKFGEHIGVKYSKEDSELLDIWYNIAKNCFWFYPYEEICVCSERPNIIEFNSLGRLHNTKGPAVQFRDGWGPYCLNGIIVEPKNIIEDKNYLTVQLIDKEENVELRRVFIEMYGLSKYLLDSKAEKIHEDKYGILFRKEQKNDEPIVTVQVSNSTPEKDGSRKQYFLRVNPNVKTAREAVASTFRKTVDQYNPDVET